jgi:pilus assembly protein Flp/PilA
MRKRLNQLGNDETGATAIEYGLIAALIFLVIVSAVNLLSGETINMYNKITSNVSKST